MVPNKIREIHLDKISIFSTSNLFIKRVVVCKTFTPTTLNLRAVRLCSDSKIGTMYNDGQIKSVTSYLS